MDGDIVSGGESTNDKRLFKFLERASKQGLKLNSEKCKIRQTEGPYMGPHLTAQDLRIDPQKVKAIEDMPEPESNDDVGDSLDLYNS